MRIDSNKVQLVMAEKQIRMMELVRKTGLSHRSVKRILTTGGRPENCGKIAEALGVAVSEIIKNDDVA